MEQLFGWLLQFGGPLREYICNTDLFLERAAAQDKRILFEAQLGALRDIEFGIYPYTSSSPTIAAYAPIGAGVPGRRLDNTIGVMKAYSTCVGEGPFTAELFGPAADALREAGGEYGAATGRPRRVGGFDVVASRTGEFPSGRRLNQAKPVYEYLDGWHRDISGCRSIDALPAAAQRYIDYLQKAVDCPIRTISVGADREAYFTR